MEIKEKIEELVEKIKSSDDLFQRFCDEPVKVIEELLDIDLPDEKLEALVEGVKAKIDLEKLGDTLGGAINGLKGLFGK